VLHASLCISEVTRVLINFVGIVGPQPLTPSNLSVEVKFVAHIKF
jgi:hypothetical protein